LRTCKSSSLTRRRNLSVDRRVQSGHLLTFRRVRRSIAPRLRPVADFFASLRNTTSPRRVIQQHHRRRLAGSCAAPKLSCSRSTLKCRSGSIGERREPSCVSYPCRTTAALKGWRLVWLTARVRAVGVHRDDGSDRVLRGHHAVTIVCIHRTLMGLGFLRSVRSWWWAYPPFVRSHSRLTGHPRGNTCRSPLAVQPVGALSKAAPAGFFRFGRRLRSAQSGLTTRRCLHRRK